MGVVVVVRGVAAAAAGSTKLTRKRPLASSPAPLASPGGSLAEARPALSATTSTWKRLWLGVGPGGRPGPSPAAAAAAAAAASSDAEGTAAPGRSTRPAASRTPDSLGELEEGAAGFGFGSISRPDGSLARLKRPSSKRVCVSVCVSLSLSLGVFPRRELARDCSRRGAGPAV